MTHCVKWDINTVHSFTDVFTTFFTVCYLAYNQVKQFPENLMICSVLYITCIIHPYAREQLQVICTNCALDDRLHVLSSCSRRHYILKLTIQTEWYSREYFCNARCNQHWCGFSECNIFGCWTVVIFGILTWIMFNSSQKKSDGQLRLAL